MKTATGTTTTIRIFRIKQSIGLQWDQIYSELYVTALTRKKKQPFRLGTGIFQQTVDPEHISKEHVTSSTGWWGCGGRNALAVSTDTFPGAAKEKKTSRVWCWKEYSSRFNNGSQEKPNQQGFIHVACLNNSKQSRIPVSAQPSMAGITK